MVLSYIWTLVQVILAVVVLFIAYMYRKMSKNVKMLDHYEKQGFVIAKGSRNIPKGAIPSAGEFKKAKDAMTDADEPLRPMMVHLHQQENTEKNMAIVFGGLTMILVINDPRDV